jgi:hypothetical protein
MATKVTFGGEVSDIPILTPSEHLPVEILAVQALTDPRQSVMLLPSFWLAQRVQLGDHPSAVASSQTLLVTAAT